MRRLLVVGAAFVVAAWASGWAAGHDLLLDSTRDLSSWRTNVGGEFPGARGSLEPATDAQRGPCLRGTFEFTGDSRYAGMEWSGEIPRGHKIGFWVKLTDRDSGMLRIRDATDQEHAGGYTATRGEWTQVEVELLPESFPGHWHGADDGKFYYPLRGVLIAVGRGPDRAEMLVSQPYVVTDEVEPADRWRLSIEPRPRSGVALRGGAVEYTVHVLNRLREPADATVGVETQTVTDALGAPGPAIAQPPQRLTVGGWSEVLVPYRLPGDKLGYWCVRATLTGAGATIGPVVSGLVVVPRPLHYGKPAPDCYFGLQSVPDMEAAERLGCKAVRLAPGWRWAERAPGLIMFEEYLDPQVLGALDHHMQVLLTLQAFAPGWAAWRVEGKPKLADLPAPDKLHGFQQFTRLVAERYRGRLAAAEIQNEPDLTCWVHPGLSFDEGVDYYVRLLRAGHSGVKTGDPGLAVAGIDVSGGDFDADLRFTRAVLDRAANLLDVYTGHPYASPRYFGPGLKPVWPIANRMAEKCVSALDLLAQYGRPRRMWIGELGWGLDNTADPLSPSSLDFAACIARALIVGKTVPGVEKMLYFTLQGCNEGGSEYGLLRGSPSYPLPAALAYATCAYVLHPSDPGELASVAGDLWRASFASPQRDQLIVAWWSQGDGVTITLPTGAPEGRWLDSFCQVLRPTGGQVKVGRLPVYWILPLAQVGPRPAFLARARVTGVVPTTQAEPVRVDRALLSARDRLGLLLSNRTGEAQTVAVQVQGATSELRVPPGANGLAFEVPLPAGVPVSTARELPVTVTAGEYVYSRALAVDLAWLEAPPEGWRPDADLGEWAAREALVVERRDQVLPPDPGIGWDGPSDLSLRAYLAADRQALYFAAVITDDEHAAPVAGPDDFWNSDSVQIAVDPRGDSGEAFGDDDREVGIVLGPGGPVAYLTHPAPRHKLDVPVAVTRRDGRTVYEAAFPWAALGLEPPGPGRLVRLSFIANENDGEGRAYWMGLTPGIGEAKVPAGWAAPAAAYREFCVSGGR